MGRKVTIIDQWGTACQALALAGRINLSRRAVVLTVCAALSASPTIVVADQSLAPSPAPYELSLRRNMEYLGRILTRHPRLADSLYRALSDGDFDRHEMEVIGKVFEDLRFGNRQSPERTRARQRRQSIIRLIHDDPESFWGSVTEVERKKGYQQVSRWVQGYTTKAALRSRHSKVLPR